MDTSNIIALIGLVMAGIAVYVKLMTKLVELETRVKSVEKQDNTILNKLDRIADDLTEIKIDLQNKEDKRKS